MNAPKTGLSRVLMLGSSGAANTCIVSQSAKAAIYIFLCFKSVALLGMKKIESTRPHFAYYCDY